MTDDEKAFDARQTGYELRAALIATVVVLVSSVGVGVLMLMLERAAGVR